MNFQRIALMVAVLAVPCSAKAFWFGSNGSCGGSYLCTAKAGYDGPTGLGTPHHATAFGQ